jgi:hypothetical protein
LPRKNSNPNQCTQNDIGVTQLPTICHSERPKGVKNL